MSAAIGRDGDAQRALLAGDVDVARAAFAEAAARYRRSWEAAPPASYGQLVGMLKSAVLAGGAPRARRLCSRRARRQVAGSPPAAYAQAIAALIADDDAAAQSWVSRMRGGSDALDRAADAIAGLAARDPTAYAAALDAIMRDFEHRAEHLTGVAIADTALMLELLAARRGITAGVQSPLLPTPRG